MNSASPVALAPVSTADQEPLARFLADFPGLECGLDFWRSRMRLWWQDNPAYAPGVPAGWILKRDGAIQGFLGNLPNLFQLEGRPLTAFSITTWMVLPEGRDHSLSLLMEHARAAESTLLFDTTPTPEVAQILESLGFAAMPWAGDRESLLILDWRRCLNAAAGGRLGPTGLPLLAAGALSPWQSRRLQPLRASAAAPAQEISEVGPEFDALWERTRGLYANTNVRTAAAVRWQCLGDPAVEKHLFACRPGGSLAGYMAVKKRTRRGLQTWDCIDFWEDPTRPGVLESLIKCAWDAARSRGVDLLSFPHFDRKLGSRLRGCGLLERASGRKALVAAAPGTLARLTPEDSYLVGLQGDYGTAVS